MATGENDKKRFLAKAREFLVKREQVRVTLQLKGREKSRPALAIEYLQGVIEELSDCGMPVNQPNLANLSVTFNPVKANGKKKEA